MAQGQHGNDKGIQVSNLFYLVIHMYAYYFSEAFELASQVDKTDGVYFVPAFYGLFAPHWRSDARGTLCGLTGHTTRQHVVRLDANINILIFGPCFS